MGEGEKLEGYRQTSLAIVFHAVGKDDESRNALELVRALGDPWAFQLATCHAVHGEYDQAIEQLWNARASSDPGLPWAGVHFVFDGLRADPRMRAFLTELGLTN